MIGAFFKCLLWYIHLHTFLFLFNKIEVIFSFISYCLVLVLPVLFQFICCALIISPVFQQIICFLKNNINSNSFETKERCSLTKKTLSFIFCLDWVIFFSFMGNYVSPLSSLLGLGGEKKFQCIFKEIPNT